MIRTRELTTGVRALWVERRPRAWTVVRTEAGWRITERFRVDPRTGSLPSWDIEDGDMLMTDDAFRRVLGTRTGNAVLKRLHEIDREGD
jgi:hypothetical protein